MRADEVFERQALAGRPAGIAGAEIDGSCLSIRGDDSGAALRLVYLDPSHVAVFSSWSRAVEILESTDRLRIDPAGCQFVLAYGLVPPPYSLYRDVYVLGVGDRLELRLDRDEATFRVDFPYLESRSRGDTTFDPDRLKTSLVAAVARAVPADEPALLMQSSGKDSTALLIGIAASGRGQVRAATYDPRYGEREASPAAELAARFGVSHRAIEADAAAEGRALTGFLETTPSICADMALIPYVYTLQCCGVDSGVVIDGLGNDTYMGYLPSRRDRWLTRIALPRRIPATWGRLEPPDLGARGSYLLKSLLMYPAERALAGSRLSPRAVRELIPSDGPFGDFFAELDRSYRDLSEVDFRAYVRGRIFDGGMTMVKGRLAAEGRGARAVYPFCDGELIDTYFNLERDQRYDVARGTNKVALRRLIDREVGDASYYLRHKGSFRYDVLRFVEVNEATIRAELERARPLFAGLDRWSSFLLRRKTNYVHAYVLTTLYLLAAWLLRRPAAVVAPLLERVRPRGAAVRIEI